MLGVRRSNRGRGRRAVMLSIGLLGVLTGVLTYTTGALDRLEATTIDARYQVRGEQDPPADTIIVAIDDVTFSELNERWPFPRSLHAEAIDRLVGDGASQIAYDVQFTEPSGRREDAALIEAVGGAPSIVLATAEVNRRGGHRVLGGERNLQRYGARAGYSALPVGEGGVLREVEHDVGGLDTFAVATAEQASGRGIDADEFPEREAWVDYAGPVGTVPEVSFSSVVNGEFESGTFAGKTVFVGATTPTLQDVHRVPTDDAEMAGAEYWANATSTVEDGFPLRSPSGAVDLGLIALLALVPVPLFRRLPPLLALTVTVAVGALFVVAAQAGFAAGWIVPVVFPLLGLLVSGVGSLGASYVFEGFDRQRARDNLARFLSDPVLHEVLDREDELRLGGRQFEATVLFGDIRGFTTFSEARPPEEIVAVLNRYLTEMAEAILDHEGTISSFIGDGIMAVFGAPIERPDHADRALAAAREMLGPRLESFNDWITAAGIAQPLTMGVGLNSGPLVSGMIGSERRLDYTAIGDVVNTAARLESMTRGTPHQLFVADSTRQRLTNPEAMAELEFVEEMEIRGRERGIAVWTVPGSGPSGRPDVARLSSPAGRG